MKNIHSATAEADTDLRNIIHRVDGYCPVSKIHVLDVTGMATIIRGYHHPEETNVFFVEVYQGVAKKLLLMPPLWDVHIHRVRLCLKFVPLCVTFVD
jgi:hypothetical protein